MTEQELLFLLESDNYDEIIRALIYIEKKLQTEPSHNLTQKLLDLCSNADADIRSEAIQAVGFYCKVPKSFPILVKTLSRHDEDELVLNSAVYALGELSDKHPHLREQGVRFLAQVSLNELMPKMIQEEAYALALRVSGQISPNEFAKMGVFDEIAIDKTLVLSLFFNNDKKKS